MLFLNALILTNSGLKGPDGGGRFLKRGSLSRDTFLYVCSQRFVAVFTNFPWAWWMPLTSLVRVDEEMALTVCLPKNLPINKSIPITVTRLEKSLQFLPFRRGITAITMRSTYTATTTFIAAVITHLPSYVTTRRRTRDGWQSSLLLLLLLVLRLMLLVIWSQSLVSIIPVIFRWFVAFSAGHDHS